MTHSVLPLPVLRVLCILLFLAAPLKAQNENWDYPTCTKGVVSVTRGHPAVMSCNISNSFSTISILLKTSGNNNQSIFINKSAGLFFEAGWQLQVQGGMALLVTQEAQDNHTGKYIWILCGQQNNVRTTSLNVLGSDRPSKLRMPESHPYHEALRTQPPNEAYWSQITTTGCIILLFLIVLALGWVTWQRKHHNASRLERFLQMWLFSAPGYRDDQERLYIHREPEIQPYEICPSPGTP